MQTGDDLKQFQLLEEKIDSLIQIINTLKNEKNQFLTRINDQEEKIVELTGEIEQLREARETARQKTVSLLEKIEQIEISI